MSEILSYEKFVENLRAYLLDALNLQEERIYFKVKDEAGMTPEGDSNTRTKKFNGLRHYIISLEMLENYKKWSRNSET